MFGHDASLAYEPWPAYDPAYTIEDEVEILLQVNGKLRDKISVPRGTPTGELERLAAAHQKLLPHLEGKTVVRIISVPDKLVNIVVK